MRYFLPFSTAELSLGRSALVASFPVQRECQLVRLIVADASGPWVWPWGKGWRRTWWGRKRHYKRETFLADATVTGLQVMGQSLLCGEVPAEFFGPGAFDNDLYSPRMRAGAQVEVMLVGRGRYQLLGLVETVD